MTATFTPVQEGASGGGASSVTLGTPTSGAAGHALIAVVLSNSATSDVVTASDGTVLTPLVWTAGHGGDFTGIFLYPDVPAGVTGLSCDGCYAIGYVEASGPAGAFANLGVVTGGSNTAVRPITLASPAGQAAGTFSVFCVGYPGNNSGTPWPSGLSDHLLSDFGQFAWTSGSGSFSATQGSVHDWDGCAVTFGIAGTLSAVPAGVFRGRCGQYATSGLGISYSKYAGMPPVAGEPLSSITTYEAWLGRQVDYVLDFMIEGPTSWTQFEQCFTTPASPLSAWGDIGSRRIMLGVPACCGSTIGTGGATWEDEAAGVNDGHWAKFGEYLIANGYGDACLRIAREFNGTWYPWEVKATGTSGVANFIAGWQHIVTLLRNLPGAEFTFMWNPFLGGGGSGISTVSSAFPGADYTDFVGLDVYDGGYANLSKPPYTRDIATQETRFAAQESQGSGLTSWVSFAAAQGVPLAYPEWGLELWWSNGYPGGGDNAHFISAMAAGYIAGAGMHALWEHLGNGVFDPDTAAVRKLNGTLLPVPQSRRAFLAMFGGQTSPPVLSSPLPGGSQPLPAGPRYRYYAQALDGTWLHRDLQVTGGSLTWGLNGGDACAPAIAPADPELYDAGGNLILPAWGCYLYVEEDDQIIWGGILNDPEYTGPTLTLNGIGFGDYSQGFIYNGDPYVRTNVDPLDVIRDLWTYIQTRGNDDPSLPTAVTSNLGLVLDSTASTARIGNTKDSSGMVIDVPQLSTTAGQRLEQFANLGSDNQLWKFSALDGQGYLTIKNKHSGMNIGIASTAQSAAAIQYPADGLDSQKWQVVSGGNYVTIINKAAGMALNVKQQSQAERAPIIIFPVSGTDNEHWVISTPDSGGYCTIASVNTGAVTPYELDWWNSTDLGQEIASLAQQAPADFAVTCSWADDSKQAVTKRLMIGSPRLGTRRSNLRFAEGENISAVVTVTNRGTEYANEVVGLGAGSGSEMLRSVVAVSDGRLLRRIAYTDQSLISASAVTAAARKELAASQGLDEVTSLTVAQHPNAPIGSYAVGDDIPITLKGPGGERVIWHRITSYTLDLTGTTVDLTTARSDTFTYLPVSTSGGSGSGTYVPGIPDQS